MERIFILALMIVSCLSFEDPGQIKLDKMYSLLKKSEDGIIHLPPKVYN
jgi:hypothetical protein